MNITLKKHSNLLKKDSKNKRITYTNVVKWIKYGIKYTKTASTIKT